MTLLENDELLAAIEAVSNDVSKTRAIELHSHIKYASNPDELVPMLLDFSPPGEARFIRLITGQPGEEAVPTTPTTEPRKRK